MMNSARPQWLARTSSRATWIAIAATIVVALTISFALYRKTCALAIHTAEGDIRELLQQHRAMHLYLQRNAHPALSELKARGELNEDFYAPEFLSSSYIVRNVHRYLNEVREEAGLPPLYYKMASTNPRNPVNEADEFERKLIAMFNGNRDLKYYTTVLEENGKKELLYAKPFLPTTDACLKCHGDPAAAPAQLVARYGTGHGFESEPGAIRAIESIRVPIEEQLAGAHIAFLAILLVAVGVGVLVLINHRLLRLVRARTRNLEQEVTERIRAEQAVRESEESARGKNSELHAQVQERLRAEERLCRNVAQLERFNRLAVGRELRMIELKKEVDELLGLLGQEPRYKEDILEPAQTPNGNEVPTQGESD